MGCSACFPSGSLHSQRRHHAGVTDGLLSRLTSSDGTVGETAVVTLLPGLTVHTRRSIQFFARIVGEMLARAITAVKGLEPRYGLTLRPLMLCPGCALQYIEATGTSC
eukprot:5140324-Amphidinium_carterae.1